MIIDADNLKRVTALGQNAVKIMFRNEQIWPVEQQEDPALNEYTTFSCDNEQYFYIRGPYLETGGSDPKNVNVYYSYDKETWTKINVNRAGRSGSYYRQSSNINFGGSYGDIYLRGYNELGFDVAGNQVGVFRFVFGNGGGVTLSGNLRSLTNYENMQTDPTVDFTWHGGGYSRLFYQQTKIVDARNLILYRDGNFTFKEMFYGCTNLAYAPQLPSTQMYQECYNSMFYGCSSLTQAPQLPATTLTNYCYEAMFMNCSSLTQAPELPATTLAQSCYRSMLRKTSLSQAPQLPATTLTNYCYQAMFMDCTLLIQAPELPATTLAQSCYADMFEGCTSLTQSPQLLATTLVQSCYAYMFNGTSLTQAPVLPSTTLAERCYAGMFMGCSNLNYIKMMATDISASQCLANWVQGVSSSGTFVKNVNATWNVTGDSGIPSGWTVQTATT